MADPLHRSQSTFSVIRREIASNGKKLHLQPINTEEFIEKQFGQGNYLGIGEIFLLSSLVFGAGNSPHRDQQITAIKIKARAQD